MVGHMHITQRALIVKSIDLPPEHEQFLNGYDLRCNFPFRRVVFGKMLIDISDIWG